QMPAVLLKQRRDAVHQHEVAEMVGAELRLEPIRSLALWASHHAGIADHHIEWLARLHQRIGASPHALQRSKIELDQLKTAAVFGILAHDLRRRLRLLQITRRADNRRAM